MEVQDDKRMSSVENFKVATIEIGGLVSALLALRLPYGLENRAKTDSRCILMDNKMLFQSGVVKDENLEKDLTLLKTLIKRGDAHSKVLRGVIVYTVVKAPRYWWQELVTHRMGVECLASESTMHIQGKGMGTEELVAMKESLPEGFMQKRIFSFSYQALRNIYKLRYDHRLPQWQIFCDWIKTLPFAQELILTGLEGTEEGKK